MIEETITSGVKTVIIVVEVGMVAEIVDVVVVEGEDPCFLFVNSSSLALMESLSFLTFCSARV